MRLPLFRSNLEADAAAIDLYKALWTARVLNTYFAIIMGKDTIERSDGGDVVADINYFPATSKPISKASWKPRYLDEPDDFTRSMTVRDVRRSERDFHLDTDGFTFISLPPANRVAREDDEETVKRSYYPELEEIARKLYIYNI